MMDINSQYNVIDFYIFIDNKGKSRIFLTLIDLDEFIKFFSKLVEFYILKS